MLTENDSLGDPADLAKAHTRSTGHTPMLIGGYGYVSLVSPQFVTCIICMDQHYIADREVVVCRCVEQRLTTGVVTVGALPKPKARTTAFR